MAIYRIKHTSEPPVSEDSSEFWQERHDWQQEDLDFDEIDELNASAGDEDLYSDEDDEAKTPKKFRPLRLLVVLIIIFTLLYWALPALFHTPWDFSVLSKSYKLSQEAAMQELNQAVVKIETATGSGTGFNIQSDGLIVTNLHVVEDSDLITIYFNESVDEKPFTATDYAAVAGLDLALIRLNDNNLPYVELADDNAVSSEEIVFIGNPLGFNWTIAQGVVKGLVMIDEIPCLYLEGPVASGSSGSPVFNQKSQVIGIVFASVRGEENTGLAIPSSYLTQALEELSDD